jgi:hypothetical protein
MNLTDNEKKKRQHEKELKSLRNKMGKNLAWFDSLTKDRQYDVLFLWKKNKYNNDLKKPKVRYVKRYSYIKGGYNIIKVIDYPPNLKHFISELKLKGKFRVSKSRFRDSVIDLILNEKNKYKNF